MIDALYRASQAGVPIQLIVRGICCLRPGIKGISDTIQVTSIVDRFLEHSRIYIFGTDDHAKIFLSSADWMPRNLDRRIEAVSPLEDSAHRQTVLQVLEMMWKDNQQAWELKADGSYVRREAAEGETPFSAQSALMEMAHRS